MAEKVLQYYKYISEQRGMMGKMELAKLTKIPSTVAAVTPDTPENIVLFQRAIEQITGQPAPHF